MAASLISYFEENGKSSGFEIFLRHSNTVNPIVQFLALNCLVNFYCDGIMAENVSLFDHIIPSLIKLLKKDSGLHSHRSNIPLMLIYIIAHDANVLEPMRELGTIKELSNIFLDTSINEGKEFLIENLLLCMSTFAADSEPSRLELVENPLVLTRIIQCISHRNQSIKIAACKCIKSLSRSVHILRKYLADADPVKALHPLLESPDVQLQSISCATLCNIILNFSSMKESLIRIGALETITNLSLSLDVEVRRNATLALKNLLFQSSLDIKKSVLSSLGVKTIKGLLTSDDFLVELNAVAMLRNLVCGNAEEIEYTLNFIGQTTFLDIISEKLCKVSAPFELKVHALYTLTNMATGSKLHKDYIIARGDILNQVVLLLGNPDSDGSNSSDIRVACLWTIINLTWNEDDHFKERIRILCQLGVDMKLKQLVISESISFDVRDRAKTAFNNFPSSKLD